MPFSIFLQSKIPKHLIFYLEMSLNKILPFIHWPTHPHTVGRGGQAVVQSNGYLPSFGTSN